MQHPQSPLRLLPFLVLQACGIDGYITQGSGIVGDANTGVAAGGNTSAGTTGGSGTVTVSGDGNVSTLGSGSTGSGRESWVWVYANWQTSLTVITSNPKSFTHISPTFYTLNYAYTSGVAYYSNCPFSSGLNCSGQGTNNFGGMTTRQFTDKVTAAGMATVPAIYAGADNNGLDTGVQNILNDTNGAGTSFINAMVAEAVTNGYAGYNLDWEMGSGVGASYATSFITFVNTFKKALAVHNMSLSVDAIVSNINGSWCSGNDGYLDFAQLAKSSIDRVIIEDYTSYLGTNTATCQVDVLSSTKPASCPVDSTNTNVSAVGLYNYMCSNLPASMVVIGFESYSTGTNPIAGSVFSAMENYGFGKVAVWPQIEGAYPFLSANKLVASQTDWYSMLSAFLAH